MSRPIPLPPRPATALRNLHRLQVAAGICLGFALAGGLVDSMRAAIAAIGAALVCNILAIEALRVAVANLPEPRR